MRVPNHGRLTMQQQFRRTLSPLLPPPIRTYIYVQMEIVQSRAGTDNVSVTEVNALAVKSGGIDTVHLADDAVEPAKLLETGAFTDGPTLTVGGNAPTIRSRC